jgi:fused signal recognition particle receptor
MRSNEISDVNHLKAILKEEALSLFIETQGVSTDTSLKPYVIMVVGVNGTGKTTTIGKLAAKYSKEGKNVLIAAADTFRAAAIEQLSIWADRAGADIVKHKQNADPSAVAFDALDAATARNVDVVLVDTAGRLHTRINLMDELKKIKRTISNRYEGAPHEILLVLDATTGQNALSQAKLFNEALGISGMVLTKLDGTAKGGIVISVCSAFNIPLSYIGVGEKIEDLQEFDPKLFIDALF